MKVVVDTNVLISALVFPGGAPEDVYRLAIDGTIELVTSPPLLMELGRVLTEKFLWEPAYAEAAVAQLVRISEVVEPTSSLRVVIEDPDDDRVLEAAAVAGATVIVSGDRHLLRLGRWRDIAIQTPAAFLEDTAGH